MKTISIILMLTFFGFVSCKQKEKSSKENTGFTEIIKDDYELYKPNHSINAVLILFGGYPEVAEDIKREFKILEIAKKNNIAVILSNLNQKLWLEKNEQQQLAKSLQNIVEDNQLPTDNIFIGGFSSGGVVSLLISNYIAAMKESYNAPKGVFIVDSPIDLAALYLSSEKNIERNFSKPSIQESTWLLETLGRNFGNPAEDIKKYEDKAVFTFSTNNTSNLKNLKNTKIRLYTEPDTIWWKKNRMADYDQTNSYYIKLLSETLKKSGFNNVEYIPTVNKGYRANGERHPHSWSIVDKKDLIDWILNKK
ncbi:hypothetical protein CXF68_18710 [Tenacibaculum sp. Bg11-29]|uniref:hypothetical protein n=1 Tax=Tenacibaculum sp. Bg11-29 TaxID=2058306 RepID=UPI000C326D67|nr:hypothetical protein [Tenacibaculum sp. Bg11-29]PKH52607.1 hypothetical protein CXF68_18710 [Tenacibaculum sp. Bg11-29]